MPQIVSGTESFTGGAYEIPATNDKGDTVFSLLETVLERLATHSHSGEDSNKISLNIEKDIEDLQAGVGLLWSDLGNENYRATLSVPSGTTYDTSVRKFYLHDGNGNFAEFYPTVEKIDNNQYYLYANEQLSNLRVVTL